MVTVAEWRKRILVCLGARIPYVRFRSRQSILEQFGDHIDDNTITALESLVSDKYVYRLDGDHDYNDSYFLNPVKREEILTVITEEVEEKTPIFSRYEPDFEGFSYWFHTESERNDKKSCRYLYYKRNGGMPHYKVLIQNKARTKSTKLDMGSSYDPDSKISHLWHVIDNVIITELFIKRDVEKIDPIASGNNRQPLKAAFDIFERLGYIVRVRHRTKYLYKKKGIRPASQDTHTFDDLLHM